MTRLQIAYHLSRDRCVSLDALVPQLSAYEEDLSDADQINDAWLQVVEDDEVLHEAQPYSMSVFLDIVTANFQAFLSGNVIWIYGLESTFVFRASANELEICFWKDVAIHQLKPFIAREIAKGIAFEMRVDLEHLPRFSEVPYRCTLSKRAWLATILEWGRDFTQILRKAQGWIASHADAASEDSARTLQEMNAFLNGFPTCEAEIASVLEREKRKLVRSGL